MSIPKSVKVDSVPGDATRRTLESATDANGKMWPAGTEFVPVSGGVAANGCDYRDVSISGRRVRFEAKR